jgi:hypothetical protein
MVAKNSSPEELNEIGISQEKDSIYFKDKTGKDCEERDGVAKVVQFAKENNDEKTSLYYYIKHRRGQLFDPYGVDALKANAQDTRYKKVDEYIFNKYNDYLKTRRETFLLEAKREFIRKGY